MKRPSSNVAGMAALSAFALLALLLSGCGSNGAPAAILVGNVRNATAFPTASATPTDVFVIAWALYGTPTPGAPGHLPVGEPHLPGQEPIKPGAGPTLPATATFPPPTPTITPTPVAVAAIGAPGGSGTNITAVGSGDPTNGLKLFQGAGTCNSCHEYQRGINQTGPTLKGVGARAVTRVEGQTAADYLYISITNPNDYIVKGFTANIMLQNFAKTLSAQQINDLVAFLLTLQ